MTGAREAATIALALTLAAFLLLVLSIDVIRARARAVQLLAGIAALGAAAAGFIAVDADGLRLQRIEFALAQRPAGASGPAVSAGQLRALAAGLARTGVPHGFLFAVLSTCGGAQARASALVATMRHAGLTVYAPGRCGPTGTGNAITILVNARAKHREPARAEAAVFGSVFVLPGAARTLVVPGLSADLIVLLAA